MAETLVADSLLDQLHDLKATRIVEDLRDTKSGHRLELETNRKPPPHKGLRVSGLRLNTE